MTLKGTIQRKVFPGPPNYESVKEGDKPEKIWVLHLPKPICVLGKKGDDINSETESGIQKIQLIVEPGFYKKYANYVGKRVNVTGTLFHSHTGHHHTRVLSKVSEIAQ